MKSCDDLRDTDLMGTGTHQPHRRLKGCALCKPYKMRTEGQAKRKPWAELRALGKRRRVARHDLGF